MVAARSVGAVLTAVALGTGLVACTSPDASPSADRAPTAPDSSATSEAAPSTSPADLAGGKALAAYTGMWDDMVEAARTSDWKDPNLGRHAAKDALRVITGSLYADHKNGVITKGQPTYDPEVTTVKPRTTPETVLIRDCADSSNSLKYFKKTGKRVSETPDGRHLIIAEVKLQDDGEWRVTRFAVQGVGSCD